MQPDHDQLSENPTQDSLTRLIGITLMTQLSNDLGGKILFIPKQPGAASPLVVSVGMVAARKIAEVYGGYHYSVPVKLGHHGRIIDEYKKGTPKATIAAKLKISRETVYRVIDAYDLKGQPKLL